jgi:hypothetical protein
VPLGPPFIFNQPKDLNGVPSSHFHQSERRAWKRFECNLGAKNEHDNLRKIGLAFTVFHKKSLSNKKRPLGLSLELKPEKYFL